MATPPSDTCTESAVGQAVRWTCLVHAGERAGKHEHDHEHEHRQVQEQEQRARVQDMLV